MHVLGALLPLLPLVQLLQLCARRYRRLGLLLSLEGAPAVAAAAVEPTAGDGELEATDATTPDGTSPRLANATTSKTGPGSGGGGSGGVDAAAGGSQNLSTNEKRPSVVPLLLSPLTA